MKVSSFFKPIARQFTKSTKSSRPKSSAGNIPSGSDKVSVDPRLTGKEAAVRASVLQAGLVSPFTAKAAARAASKPTKSAGGKVGVDSKAAGTQKARVASHPTSYASPRQAAVNATLTAHAAFGSTATQTAAQRAAKPLSFIGKVRAFFRELGDKNS